MNLAFPGTKKTTMRLKLSLVVGAVVFASFASVVSFALAQVNPPVNLKAELQYQNNIPGVQLTWNSGNGDEKNFVVESSTDGVNFSPLETVSTSTTSVWEPTHQFNTRYWYRIAPDGDNNNASDSVTLFSYSDLNENGIAAYGGDVFQAGNLNIQVDTAGNPSTTQYVVRLVPGECGNPTGNAQYVGHANKDENFAYLTNDIKSAWSQYNAKIKIDVAINNVNEPYCVSYTGRNGDQVQYKGNVWSAEKTVYTSTNVPYTITLSNVGVAKADLHLVENDVTAETLIYNKTTDKYLLPDGTWTTNSSSAWANQSKFSQVTVKDLTPNTTYELLAKARNAQNIETQYSDVVSFTTKKSNPVAPINFTVANILSSEATVVWQQGANGLGTENRYIIERSTDGVDFPSIDAVETGLFSYHFVDLIPNTKYWFRISSADEVSKSASVTIGPVSTKINFSNVLPQLASIGTSTVRMVNMRDILSNDSPKTQIKILLGGGLYMDSNFHPTSTETWLTYGDVGSGATFLISDLEPATYYDVQVVAKDVDGNEYVGSRTSFGTLAPIPASIVVSNVNFTQANLSVNEGAKNAEVLVHNKTLDKYLIAGDGTWVSDSSSAWSDSSNFENVVIKGLTPGTTYQLEAKARGANIETAYGDTVSFTTKVSNPAVPAQFAVKNVASTSVTVSWKPGDNGQGTEDHYIVEKSDDGVVYNTVGNIPSNSSYTFTYLSPNAKHWFRIAAADEVTQSDYANIGPVVTGVDVTGVNAVSFADITTSSARVTNMKAMLGDSLPQTPVKITLANGVYLDSNFYPTNKETWLTYADLGLGNDITISGLNQAAAYQIAVTVKDLGGNEFVVSSGNFSTLADVPAETTLSEPATSGFKVTVNAGTNAPEKVEYVVHETTQDLYLQSNGSWLGQPAWLTYAQLGAENGITTFGLSANTQYTVETKVRNADKVETGYGPSASIVTHADFPVAPESVNYINAGSDFVSIQIVNNNNLGTEKEYVIELSDDGGKTYTFWTTLPYDHLAGAKMSYMFAPLTADSEYHFRVATTDGNATSSYTYGNMPGETHAARPAAPQVDTPTPTTLTLHMDYFADLNPLSTRFALYNVTDGNYIDWLGNPSQSMQTDFKGNLPKVVVANSLVPNKPYQFKVVAVSTHLFNDYATSSANVSVYTLPTIPGQPTLVNVGPTQVKVGIQANGNFDANTEYLVHETGSNLYLQKDGTWQNSSSSAWQTFTELGGVNGVVTSGLKPQQTVSVHVKARSVYDHNVVSGYSQNSVTVLDNGPVAPANVQASVFGNFVTVSWNPGVNEDGKSGTEDHYILEMKEDGAQNFVFVDTIEKAGVKQSYLVVGLKSGIKYNFRLASADKQSTSTYSNVVSATTEARIPGQPGLISENPYSIRVFVDENKNDEATTEYLIYDADLQKYIVKDGTVTQSSSSAWASYADFGGQDGIVVSGLLPLSLHDVFVKARDTQNHVETAYSVPSQIDLKNGPAKPIGISAAEQGRHLSVNWGGGLNYNNAAGTENVYNLEVSTDNGKTFVPVTTTPTIFNHYDFTPSEYGIDYIFRVNSADQKYVSPYTTSDSVHTKPVTPNAAVVKNVTQTTAQMYLDRSANSTNTVWYEITDEETGADLQRDGTWINNVSVWVQYEDVGGDNGILVKGMYPSTTYSVKVRVKDLLGNVTSYSSTTSFTTDKMHKPNTPVAEASGLKIKLSFDFNDGNEASSTEYYVFNTTGGKELSLGKDWKWHNTFAPDLLTREDLGNGSAFLTSGQDLIPKTTHAITIRAMNLAANQSVVSDPATVTLGEPVVAAPADMVVMSVNTSTASVAWTPGNGDEDYFNLFVNGEKVDVISAQDQKGNLVKLYSFENLQPNTQYTFGVSATYGQPTIVDVDTQAAPVYTRATTPANLLASVDSETQITLTWDGNATDYQVFNATANTSSAWLNNKTFVATGLSCDTKYIFAVKGRNGMQIETDVATIEATTNACPKVAQVPVNLSVSTATSSALFGWQQGKDGNETKFNAGISVDGKNFDNNFVNVVQNQNAYNVEFNGLKPNTQYTFRVSSIDAQGAPSLYVSTQKYTLASVPANLAATVDSDSQITLNWSGDASTYSVQYGALKNPMFATTSVTNFVAQNLACGVQYTFELTAYNGDGVPTDSQTVTATTKDCQQAPYLHHIVVSPKTARVTINTTEQFTVKGFDQFGNDFALPKNIVWSTSGGGTIDANGLFTAGNVAGGTFTVTVSADANITDTADVTIEMQQGGGGNAVPAKLASIAASGITTSTADLAWVAGVNGSETQFVLSVSDVNGVVFTKVYQTSTLSDTVTGLAPSTMYTASIVSTDGSSTSTPVSTSFTTANEPKNPVQISDPVITGATSTAMSVTVNWQPGANGVPLTYNVRIAPSGTNNYIQDTVGGVSYTFNNLTPNVSYDVSVQAVDANNQKSGYAQSSVYTLASVPTNLRLVGNVGETQVTLAWDGDGTEYFVENKTNVANTGWIVGKQITINGLACENQYDFHVKAKNGSGNESDYTQTLNVATAACPVPGAPVSPTNIVINNITRTSLNVSWNQGVGGSETMFVVLANGLAVTTTSLNTTSFKVENLNPNTNYLVQIVARDDVNDVNSAPAGDTATTFVDVPAIQKADANGMAEIDLAWTGDAGSEYYVTLQSGKTTLKHGWTNNTTYAAQNLACGTAYNIEIKARNLAQKETQPATANATTADCPVVVNNAPTVANPSAANPQAVSGTTSDLSVLGADDNGEQNLTYTWSADVAPAPVTFSVNSNNAAKNTTATFTQAGDYTFTVTITDQGGKTTTSQVMVKVEQTLNSITVSPGSATLTLGDTQAFAVAGKDQFGSGMNAIAVWSVDNGGTIDAKTGLFTANKIDTFTVTATSGNKTATAAVTVSDKPAVPVLTSLNIAPQNTSLNVGNSVQYTVSALDQFGKAFAVPAVTWSVSGGGSIGANGVFNANAVGQFTVQVTDNAGHSATTSVTVSAVPNNAGGGGGGNFFVGFGNGGTPVPNNLRLTVDQNSMNYQNNTIAVTLTASNTLSEMTFSLNKDFSGASWVKFATNSSFAFGQLGNGTYTVYAKIRNIGGESAPTTATFVVNRPVENVGGQVLGEKISYLDELIAKTKYRETSDNVRDLQNELRKAGYMAKNWKATRYYGVLTKTAVEKYLADKLSLDDLIAQTKYGQNNYKVYRLQKLLTDGGFMPKKWKPTYFYGVTTKKGVAAYLAQK